ncbi:MULTISPECIES: hypothetical protein [unclassified Acinetobacter]|uniref:hypothetical protein n=1 Tax=unclassified Acinetobacter TaxID=196816 RepID=UPI0029349BBE|nr:MULTISPECIES: hypothetical protein [unclassified Acinetobacter]WOE31951.1 hypothetical protein QSG84_01620 [Acinetobacter sp. SAAs470]WOE37419.1 hypothetical protein QSG86_10665 [Acinetobacter sp. SAAs474]
MNNLISAQEAFNAMLSGKNVMCRAIGEMLDFNDIDQFPATIFAKAGYEFCIKIEMISVAGIEFTKPLTLDEYQEGQEVFIVNTYGPSIYVVNFKTSALVEAINSGFVQRDAENAKLQLKALSKILGCELDNDLSVVRLGEEPKEPKKRTSRKKTEGPKSEITIVEQGPIDVVEDSLSEKITEEPKLTVVQGTIDDLYASFEYQIQQATTPEALVKIRSVFSANGTLSDKEHNDLNACFSEKLAELDPEQHTPKNDSGELSVVELRKLQQEAENMIYQERLNDLVARAKEANSPAEANALVKYTTAWTEEQRKPLMKAINARLIELDELNKVESEPPSLMVQIKNAADLTELDALEIDVASRHPDIQPKLMACVIKRRKELESMS